jgi:hypothetical protein
MEFDMIGHSASLRQYKAVAPSVASFSSRAWSFRFYTNSSVVSATRTCGYYFAASTQIFIFNFFKELRRIGPLKRDGFHIPCAAAREPAFHFDQF